MARDDDMAINDHFDAGKIFGDLLLNRLANDEADPVQKASLDQWLEQHPEVWEEVKDLNDQDRLQVLIERYRQFHSTTARAYSTFLANFPDAKARRRPVLYYYISGAAAAVLLALSITLLVRYHRKPETPAAVVAPHPQPDLAPGGNKAVLTLSSGANVVLDSAHSGRIQGTQIVNNASGLLSYRSLTGNHDPQQYNTIVTGRGGQYRLILSDGTKVWLDASSSLRYPTAFNGPTREVTLTGQGYFEVAHHKEPFTVHAAGTDVLDLGTAFNVNAYPESKDVITTLIEGAVKVGSTTLHPGQQIAGAGPVTAGVDLDEVTAWKDGRTQFTDVPLSTVLQYLSRWYDVDIVDQTGLNKKVVISVPRDVPISVLMKALEQTNRIKYTIEGKTMTVTALNN